jgi:hypothetical protein
VCSPLVRNTLRATALVQHSLRRAFPKESPLVWEPLLQPKAL